MYWYQFCTGFNSKLFLDHFSATEMHIEQGSSIVYRSFVFQWKCRLSAASRSPNFHQTGSTRHDESSPVHCTVHTSWQ